MTATYSEYALTVIPWAHRIPAHWTVRSGRYLTEPIHRPPSPQDGVVTAFRDGQVTLRSNRRTDGFTEALQEIGYQGVRRGELVVHSMDGFAGAIGVSDSDGKMSPVVHIWSVRGSDARYLAHALRVSARSGYVQSLARGIRERSTAFDKSTFKSMLLPVPPVDEQRAIADALDAETVRIDCLLDEQTGLIETLRERRIGLIRAGVSGVSVGGRINPDGDWFGALPDHWKSGSIKRFFSVVLGKMLNANLEANSEAVLAPYLAAGSIQPEELLLDGTKRMSFTSEELERYSLASGDVIVVEGGAGYGRSHLLEHDLPGWGFQNHVARLRESSGEVDSAFVTYCLKACLASGYVEANNRTATLPSLSSDVLGSIRIPVPPLDEQRRIAEYLDEQNAKIDALIAEAEAFIELATERRAALITAAVTGELNIAGVAA